MLREKTYDIGTIRLTYAEGPSGGKPLILLHGATVRWQSFLSVLPMLSFRYHTYSLDLRGHGRSSRAPGAYYISNEAEDVITFLQEKIKKPVILLGHSLGAIVSVLVAAKTPELVQAVVLEDPPLAELTDDPGEVATRAYQWFQILYDIRIMDGAEEEQLAALAPYMEGENAAGVRHRLKELNQSDPEHLTLMIEQRKFEQYRLKNLLPKITCPVLLLQSNPEKGGALDHAVAQLALSLLPDCTHVYMQDAGHNIHMPQPVKFYQIVSDFLESI